MSEFGLERLNNQQEWGGINRRMLLLYNPKDLSHVELDTGSSRLQYKREAAFNEHSPYKGSNPWLKGPSGGETGYGSTAAGQQTRLKLCFLAPLPWARGPSWWKGQTNKPSFSVDTEKGTPREIYARCLLSVSKNSTTAQW